MEILDKRILQPTVDDVVTLSGQQRMIQDSLCFLTVGVVPGCMRSAAQYCSVGNCLFLPVSIHLSLHCFMHTNSDSE